MISSLVAEGLLLTMWRVPATSSAIIRHIRFAVSLLTMDQPCQRVPGNACHQQCEQRVLVHPLGHDPLTGANGLLPLGIVHLLVGRSACLGHTRHRLLRKPAQVGWEREGDTTNPEWAIFPCGLANLLMGQKGHQLARRSGCEASRADQRHARIAGS